jgi:hypothetical protein
MTDDVVPDEDVHTVPRDGAWVNEVLGLVVDGSFATQEEAAAAGREVARQRGVGHRIDAAGSPFDSGATGGQARPSA